MRLATPLILALALMALATAPAAHAAKRSVPFGFMGVDFDPSSVPPGDLDPELALMAARGVESIRTTFSWKAAQPYASQADVPASDASRFQQVGSVPTDFSRFDTIVAAAAARRITVLPVVLTAPGWAATPDTSEPQDPATYARFLTALVGRYGPRGTLWSQRPDLPRTPIRKWQIWNEPNLRQYWKTQPWPTGYVRLLRAADASIKRADAGAKVVLGGLVNFSWSNLRLIYEAGGGGAFDVAAIHPYTAKVANVIKIIRLARKVMARHGGSRTPIALTELSWPSSATRTTIRRGFETTEKGQAKRLSAAYIQLARVRRAERLDSAYWYDWASPDRSTVEPFDYAGLRKLVGAGVVSKPALGAYGQVARSLEGCAKKSFATRCR